MVINPYIRFALYGVWLKKHYINRVIWDHEIGFVDKGSLKITIDNNVYIAKQNDFFILRPNINHIIEWTGEDCDQPHVHFDFIKQPDSEKVGISFLRREQMTPEQLTFFRDDFFKDNNIDMPVIVHVKNTDAPKKLLFRLIDEFNKKDDYSEIIMQGLLIQLIGCLLKENSNSSNDKSFSNQLNEIIFFMSKNIDSNLSLEEISSTFNLTTYKLLQLFKNEKLETPIKYYHHLRHQRAIELLQNTVLTVKEISNLMNFEDSSTFSRWFKSIDGNYPSYYRRN